MLQHFKSGPEFIEDYVLSVSDVCFRIYENKLIAQTNSESPILNIPIGAIEGVVEYFDNGKIVNGCRSSSQRNI
jgi:hypothetical protein